MSSTLYKRNLPPSSPFLWPFSFFVVIEQGLSLFSLLFLEQMSTGYSSYWPLLDLIVSNSIQKPLRSMNLSFCSLQVFFLVALFVVYQAPKWLVVYTHIGRSQSRTASIQCLTAWYTINDIFWSRQGNRRNLRLLSRIHFIRLNKCF